MPRPMPRFDLKLATHAQVALSIVSAGETMRSHGGALGLEHWSISKLESLYELAFLRVFAAWEMCQEAVFFRALCGFSTSAGQETLAPIMPGLPPHLSYYPTLQSAETGIIPTHRRFLLWHDPNDVIKRCRRFIRSAPHGPAVLETTITSDLARLEQLSAVRHRIVHTHQQDARNNFDKVTRALAAGRTYDASRPGKFLRDFDSVTGHPKRWLHALTEGLVALATQLV